MSVDCDSPACAPRAARRIAYALADPSGKEAFFGQFEHGISDIMFLVEPTVLIPARGNGNIAVSVEVGDLVIDGDFTVHGLASIVSRGREQIATNEVRLSSLCEDAEAYGPFGQQGHGPDIWQQIAEIAVAMAIKDPDAALALEGRKEWVSIVANVDGSGSKRLSVTSGSGHLCHENAQQPTP